LRGALERLTQRERDILQLVAAGLANKEIARQLQPPCSEETVKGHLKDIFLKLDVRNRAEAAIAWDREERRRQNGAPRTGDG